MLSKQSVQIQEKDRMLMQAEKETMRANLLRAMSHDPAYPSYHDHWFPALPT